MKTRVEYEAEVANLKGQVEAYQEQLRSMAIEVLRMRVQELCDRETSREAHLVAIRRDVGRLEAKTDERLAKASVKFVEMRDRIEQLERANNGSPRPPGENVDGEGQRGKPEAPPSGGRPQGQAVTTNGSQGNGG